MSPPPMILRLVTCRRFLHLFFLLCFLSGARSDDVQILLKLKEAFHDSDKNVFNSWNSSNYHCNFTGIFCNSDQFVTQIELPEKGLVGSLPFDSICQLKSLERLNLGSNLLHGVITEHLRNCTKLQYLNLSMNSFVGALPDLSSLGELKDLVLHSNGFSGAFPGRSIENLTNLVYLSLGDNQFERSRFPMEILKFDKLYWLYLTNCSLEGEIPVGIGNLTNLVNLEFSHNYLSGEIPADISKLKNLWQFELYENDLTGKIPVGFRNLTNLVNFDASANKLVGDLSELKSLTKLKSLQLFENHFSGEIPEEFGEFKDLLALSLYTNNLTGPLPQKIGSWADFQFIDVSENHLTGPIPHEMCKNGKMEELLILKNNFTGGIPPNYGNCSSLTRIVVSMNSLSGIIPGGIWGLPKLNYMDLSMNQFEGLVTSEIENAKSLAQLRIQKNRFSGNLPSEISRVSSLVQIDFSSNQFSGEIPGSIGELKTLNSLYLHENMFSGTIPDSLGSCSSLNNINLAHNSLSGLIPTTLGFLPSLNSLNLSTNHLSGQIPAILSSLKLSLLDLSNNRLSGEIPESLSLITNKDSFAGNLDLCSQNNEYFRQCSLNSDKSHQLRILISCLFSGTTLLLVSFACFIFIKKRQQAEESSSKQDSWEVKSFRIISFNEQEILNSIKPENLIGKGGSGNVYKVVMGDGRQLAIKHIWNLCSGKSSSRMMVNNGMEKSEFDAEVATLSSIQHVNVVKLFCSITSEDSNLLVYEFLPNGSLWDRLHMCPKMELDWNKRYEIAVGAAKGLEYLHHGCEKQVIHRDVKSSNILLDEFFKPRIADFGVSKIVQGNGTKNFTQIIPGTYGYIAPEYAYTHKVNERSDVYSFGVVLMELVTGKKPIEPEFGDNKDIVYWVCNKVRSRESNNIMDVVDSRVPDALKDDAIRVLKVAILCTAKLPALRPSMRSVVQMLEDAQPQVRLPPMAYMNHC